MPSNQLIINRMNARAGQGVTVEMTDLPVTHDDKEESHLTLTFWHGEAAITETEAMGDCITQI